MRKGRILLWLIIASLALSSCRAQKETGTVDPEQLFQSMDFGLSEGHFYFAGEVLRVSTVPEWITYYEEETEKNTFYQVRITDDYFGCMPEDPVTVCVFGTREQFPQRTALKKGEEYLFDATFWVRGEGAVFLLPTFYKAFPARQGEQISYTDLNGRAAAGTYKEYRAELEKRAAAAGYSAKTVLEAIRSRLESAASRDRAYFEEKGFAAAEKAEQTAARARLLIEKMDSLPENWEGIREVLS